MVAAACVTGFLAGFFLPAAPAQTATQAEPEKTLGAPPELRAAAQQVDDLLKEGRFDEARAICQYAYDSATDDAVRALALRGIGETYKEQHLTDRAIETFRLVIERYPQSEQVSWAKLGIAECYQWRAKQVDGVQNNAPKFMALLDEFVRQYPKHERVALALYLRGWGYEQLGNDGAALAEYRRAVELYANYSWADLCLGRAIQCLQRLEQWDDAIACARQYIQLYPQRGPCDAQLSIGFSCVGKGDGAQAVAEFDKVMSQYPEAKDQCAVALFHKARAQSVLGDVVAARASLERLLVAYPEHRLAGQAQDELAAMGED